MKRVTVYTLPKSILAALAIVLIAAPALGHSPAAGTAAPTVEAGHSASAAAAGTGWKEMQLRYPGSDAVVLYDSLVVTLGSDNRVTKRRHRAVMLFTDNAINRYGDPRILFSAATQNLTILAARVRMRDGTIADTRKNGINQTTPFALDLAPDYADWQETVVTHMGIEKGCIAELHYAIADKSPSPYLSGVEVFDADDRTQERVLMVKLPPGMTLKFAHLSQGAPAPDTGTSGTWVWTVRDIPGRTPFDGGVWEGDYFPAVCYGTAADWKELLSQAGTSLAAAATPVPAAEGSILDAVKDCATDEEKALAVHRLAIGAVTSVRAPFTLLAAPVRDAARIYDTGYASPLDRAVLLAAMLRVLTYQPEFVLVSAGTAPVGDVPAAELFPSIAVSVPLGSEGELLLDPMAPLEQDPSFSRAGKTLAHLGSSPRLEQLPVRNETESRSELHIDLLPGPDGCLEGTGTAILKGAFSPYYLVREGDDGLADFLKKRVSGFFDGADLVSWNPRSLDRDGAEIDFAFTVQLPDKNTGERLYLTMPRPLEAQIAGIDRVPAGRSQLEDALRIEQCALDVSCTIRLPEAWKRITASYAEHESNGIGNAQCQLETEADGTLRSRSDLRLLSDRVSPGSFGDFKSLLQVRGRDLIVLEKK
jgi:hypothetical protein